MSALSVRRCAGSRLTALGPNPGTRTRSGVVPQAVKPPTHVEIAEARSRAGLRHHVAIVSLAVSTIVSSAAPRPVAAAEPTAPAELSARAILDHVDDLFRGDSAHGRAVMTVKTEHWERSLTLEFWSKGKDLSLIRILAPKKEAGTATLKVGNELWNYLPKVKRVIKLPSSMMSASWMGSHFTNDDLVKESRMTVDYDFAITSQGRRDDEDVIELTLHPKENAPVVWGKVVVVVRAQDYLPIVVTYYDEDLDLARTLTYRDIRELGGRRLPVTMRMVPADKPDEMTEVTYETIEFDVKLPEDLFSLRELQR
jgi:outer membrane lipoprotein-sorting protein